MENRDLDKKIKIYKENSSTKMITLDQVKNLYIASGMDAEQIAENTFLTIEKVQKIIEEHQLETLRKIYIREGVAKIQNQQVGQAQRLLDVELNFKKLRIVQLEKQLEDYLAYYARHGDFYKRHPLTGEILKDTDGIPMQVFLPNVSKEISQLKESVTLSEGLRSLMTKLDDIINGKPKGEAIGDDVIDMTEVDGLFKKKV